MHRTTQKTSTNTTLYMLTFGHNTMILVELTILSLKRAKQLSMSLSEYQLAIMIELYDCNEVRLLALDHLVVEKKRKR